MQHIEGNVNFKTNLMKLQNKSSTLVKLAITKQKFKILFSLRSGSGREVLAEYMLRNNQF